MQNPLVIAIVVLAAACAVLLVAVVVVGVKKRRQGKELETALNDALGYKAMVDLDLLAPPEPPEGGFVDSVVYQAKGHEMDIPVDEQPGESVFDRPNEMVERLTGIIQMTSSASADLDGGDGDELSTLTALEDSTTKISPVEHVAAQEATAPIQTSSSTAADTAELALDTASSLSLKPVSKEEIEAVVSARPKRSRRRYVPKHTAGRVGAAQGSSGGDAS